jgi:hypothetical protein
MIRQFISSQGGRRLAIFVLVFATASVFLWFGKIGEATWSDITWKVATAAIAGMTATGVSDRFGKRRGQDEVEVVKPRPPAHPPLG